MGLPANVGFGRVTGRLIRAILDGPSDPDTEPDGVPIEGAGGGGQFFSTGAKRCGHRKFYI